MFWRIAKTGAPLLVALFALTDCIEENAEAGSSDEKMIQDPQTVPSQGAAGDLVKSPLFFRGTVIASDPSIVEIGSGYRMFYTDLDTRRGRTVIATAVSTDGLDWTTEGRDKGVDGLVMAGEDGRWDENVESAAVVKSGDTWSLYFSGYRDRGNPFKGFPAALFLATSTDGRNFQRVSDDPVLAPTKGWYDNDAIYSPTILRDGGTYYMIYVGHAYTDTSKIGTGGVFLLAAESPDGRNWTKLETPIARPGQFSDWRADGIAEPYLVKQGPGKFLLFFTGLSGERRAIGVAQGATPLGPFKFGSTPIIEPGARGAQDEHQVLAPAAVLTGNKLTIWYLAANSKEMLTIGKSEGTVPSVLGASE
ncbi:hypothetical protein [Ruegeria marina]|uniref:Glycosyl hydrolases family 43 n=1 Tax=Ruegeria marina TaxID=639004 RepID=A0A1G6VKA2_9RHOB|nr:hypothetical protein [Ruegeria marina]SDD53823.1 hypothetical protein SAMN04488239_10880 [Ruegeria marina]